jgi:type IV pilus assembly protein PilB
METRKKLGEILLDANSITKAQLDEALKEQLNSNHKLGELLVDKGVLTQQQVTEALGLQFMLPVVNVNHFLNNVSAINSMPRSLMERLDVFPLELQNDGSTLVVAISDPLDADLQDELRMVTPLDVRFALATKQSIRSALSDSASGVPAASMAGMPSSPTVPVLPIHPQPIIQPQDVVQTQPLVQPQPPVQTQPPIQPQPTAQPQAEDQPRPEPPTKNIMDMMRSQPKLGDILVQAGVISDQQLQDALTKQRSTGRRLGEILISENIITEVRLAEALSTQLKLPMFTLTRYRPMPEAIKSVPRHVAERLQVIPLSIVEGDLLLVAMVNPLDLLGQDEIRMLTGRDLKIGITTETEIKNNLDRLFNLQGQLEEAIVEVIKDGGLPMEDIMEASADDAPVIQLVSNVLEQAVREGASDIHVEPYEKNARIRYRVDGALYTAFDYPIALHPAVSARMKIMAGMDIAEKRKPQDGRILMKGGGRRIDLRVSSLPTLNGEKMVLRILDQQSSAVGLERLGLEDDDMEKIEVFCNTPWGIMLVTGPTGSGKSTTLYSILQKINDPDVNIITVEDPVEFTVAGINQVHVNEKAGLTFESALRSILRQDPDKVMVGEIRDQKTAQIAIRAALTGHFVLSTLHTNDAPSAATRMIDMGVAAFLVSASLSGIIAQRLVRKLCPFCKEEYEMPPNMCDSLRVPHGTCAWKPVGCNDCRQGYKGRKGIYEIMLMDDDLRRMILEGVSNIVLRAEAINRGMKTLRQSGINNALAGFTSIEEVFSTTL